MDHSPHSIYLKDLEGQYTLVNSVFAERCGLPAKELVGKTVRELFPPEFAESAAAHDREVVETGGLVERQYEIPWGGGSDHTVPSTKFPVRNDDGQFTGVGLISTDITEHKQIEAQLRESQKMEAVGQLAGRIAHDFNNMLQLILNYSQFARDHLHDPQKIDEFLGYILKSGNRAANLTRQLLTFSRRSVIQKKSLNLNKLISDLMNMVARVIGEQIHLKIKLGDELHYVEADPGLVEQVILNLCINARDAMPDGGRLIIETQNLYADDAFCNIHGWESPGSYVAVSVNDNGVGMSPDIQERVFEPFFTTKEAGKGTGLGLAMAYGIVQQHNGQIIVSSEQGVGSTFKIYLPRAESIEKNEEEPIGADAQAAAKP